jgi:hypothetical protein
VADGSFGESFPDSCNDRGAIVGTDWRKWYNVMRAEVADIAWPFDANGAPATLTILDLVEFGRYAEQLGINVIRRARQ